MGKPDAFYSVIFRSVFLTFILIDPSFSVSKLFDLQKSTKSRGSAPGGRPAIPLQSLVHTISLEHHSPRYLEGITAIALLIGSFNRYSSTIFVHVDKFTLFHNPISNIFYRVGFIFQVHSSPHSTWLLLNCKNLGAKEVYFQCFKDFASAKSSCQIYDKITTTQFNCIWKKVPSPLVSWFF